MRYAISLLAACITLSACAREKDPPRIPQSKESPRISREKEQPREQPREQIKEQVIKERNSKEKEELADAAPNWKERAVPGAPVTLRVKRAAGKFLLYDSSLERSQNSKNSFHEMNEFYLNVLCAEQADGMDRVVMQRVYHERKRDEILENGKKREALLPNTQELVNLGADFIQVGAFRCYPIDSQNRVAFRSEQQVVLNDGRQVRGRAFTEDAERIILLTSDDKVEIRRSQVTEVLSVPNPHVILNDTQHYLFPLLPERAVSPGESWKFKVPLIIPIDQGSPPKILPTQFEASMIGRLREVRTTPGGPVALIDYKVSGSFDSTAAEHQYRFNTQFHASNQIVHRITGDGTISLDLTTGRILDKTESFNILLYGSSMVIPEVDRKDKDKNKDRAPKKEENKAEIFTRMRMRLMMPGERAKTGAVIPPYD